MLHTLRTLLNITHPIVLTKRARTRYLKSKENAIWPIHTRIDRDIFLYKSSAEYTYFCVAVQVFPVFPLWNPIRMFVRKRCKQAIDSHLFVYHKSNIGNWIKWREDGTIRHGGCHGLYIYEHGVGFASVDHRIYHCVCMVCYNFLWHAHLRMADIPKRYIGVG